MSCQKPFDEGAPRRAGGLRGAGSVRGVGFLRSLMVAALVPLAAVGGGAGCAPKIEPEIASASGESMYAAGYPAELQRTTDDITAAEAQIKELSGKFAGYPDALKSPPWAKVLEIVEKADAGGRAYAYVGARREVDGARAFFEAEKDEIVRKVAGSAQAAAKSKGVDLDVSGAVSHSLKDTVEKRLSKRLREQCEAHVMIERNQAALGKDNVGKLNEQADEIALASYVAHVAIVEHKVRLRRMIEEGQAIKVTLDAQVRAEQAYQAESGRTAPEKKASEERAEAMRKAAASVDSAVLQARSASEGADQRIEAAQKAYEGALGKLRAEVKKRAG